MQIEWHDGASWIRIPHEGCYWFVPLPEGEGQTDVAGEVRASWLAVYKVALYTLCLTATMRMFLSR